MEYTLYILLLPALSFLLLALAGMKMGHRTAGLIGTLSLAIVAVLSWWAAAEYFTMPRQLLSDPTMWSGCLLPIRCILTWAYLSTLCPYSCWWLSARFL